jgi:hypothetical protein
MTRRIELETTPYRAAETRVATCNLCGHEAEFCCPRCARPLCVAHSVRADHRCESCEAQYHARRRWIDNVSWGSGMAVFAGLIGLLGYSAEPKGAGVAGLALLGVCAVVVAGLLAGGLWTVVAGLLRRRFLAEGDGNLVIADSLRIAPDGGADDARRKVGMGYTIGNRGLPSVPLYQRTYGH